MPKCFFIDYQVILGLPLMYDHKGRQQLQLSPTNQRPEDPQLVIMEFEAYYHGSAPAIKACNSPYLAWSL